VSRDSSPTALSSRKPLVAPRNGGGPKGNGSGFARLPSLSACTDAESLEQFRARSTEHLQRGFPLQCEQASAAARPGYDCLAASRLARYSRSSSSSGLSASYLDSTSEISFDLASANLAVTFTAALAAK